MKHLFTLSIIALITISSTQAQEGRIGAWFQFKGNMKFAESKQWNWTKEVQYRSFDWVGDTQQFLARTGIGYKINDNFHVFAGYAFFRNASFTTTDEGQVKMIGSEHRPYQALTISQKFKGWQIGQKYVAEQRIIKDAFEARFRYVLSATVPLNNKSMEPKTVFLKVGNDLLLQTKGDVFDQNWVFGSVGYKANDYVTASVGYLNQIFKGGNSVDQLTFNISLSY